MINREAILIIERFIVLPLMGYFIAHGFLTHGDMGWLVDLLDNVFAFAFVTFFYWLTHRKSNPEQTTISLNFWNKFKGFFVRTMSSPKVTTVSTANTVLDEQPTQ
jgi:hypothetical protein